MQLVPTSAPPPVTAQSVRLADGDPGVAFTISNMRVKAEQGAVTPAVREYALQTVSAVPSRDTRGEIEAIFRRVKREIAFRGEFGEVVQDPATTLRWKAGDCDDHATLLASLLLALGYDAEFVTVAPQPGDFSHVYVEVQDKRTGQWLPLDTTTRASYVGWEPFNPARRRTWGTMRGLSGLAGYGLRDPDPSQTSTTGQIIASQLQQTLQPLVQAYAYRVQYPQGGPTVGLNLNGNAMLLAGAFLAVLAFPGGRRGRR